MSGLNIDKTKPIHMNNNNKHLFGINKNNIQGIEWFTYLGSNDLN